MLTIFTLPEYRDDMKRCLTENAANIVACKQYHSGDTRLMNLQDGNEPEFFNRWFLPTNELFDFKTMNKIDVEYIRDLNIELCTYLKLRNIFQDLKLHGTNYDDDMIKENSVFNFMTALNANIGKVKTAYDILTTLNKTTKYTNPLACDIIHIDRDAKFNYNVIMFTLNSEFLNKIDRFDYDGKTTKLIFRRMLLDVLMTHPDLEVRDLPLIELFEGFYTMDYLD